MATPEKSSQQTSNNNTNQNQLPKQVASKAPTIEEQQKIVQQNCQEMFEKVGTYIKGEVELTKQDFALLETMNKQTTEKYVEMTKMAEGLTGFMDELQKKYIEFEPYVEKIEQIDNNVSELENTAILLDEYTKRLEEKFKRLQIQKREAKKQ